VIFVSGFFSLLEEDSSNEHLFYFFSQICLKKWQSRHNLHDFNLFKFASEIEAAQKKASLEAKELFFSVKLLTDCNFGGFSLWH